jgi:hypothetical protein
MNRDQRLLEEAYESIYESVGSFHDDRLTEKEEQFVDRAVEAIVAGYPYSLSNYVHIFKALVQKIFKGYPDIVWVSYISAIREIIGNADSSFNQMHKAGLIVTDNEKDKEELKENFKKQVAANIAKRFGSESLYTVVSSPKGRAYCAEREKEVRDKKIQKKLDTELDPEFDIDLKDF